MDIDRLDQINNVLTELVRIVGNTNAAVEELRADVAELKTDVTELKTNQQRLEKNQQILLENQRTLEEKYYDMSGQLDRLETKVDTIITVQNQQSEILDVLAARSIRQEAEIKTLKQVK